MVDPSKVALFVPGGLKGFKQALFDRIGKKIEAHGGLVVRGDFNALEFLPDDWMPIVGCTPALRPMIDKWRQTGRKWIYWDRGYARRVFATCLPVGTDGGYYRWHVGSFQMLGLREVPPDRWNSLNQPIHPWGKPDRGHVVIAAPTETYSLFHRTESWIARTIKQLAMYTDRQLVIRDKEQYRIRPIQKDIEGAHCLVTHASNAAVESVILGCPVFVHEDSAAALVGSTNLSHVEKPVRPDRDKWAYNLAYCQFNEKELVDGTLWKLLQ